MKSMKRFTALALSLLVMLSLCACGSSSSEGGSSTETTTTKKLEDSQQQVVESIANDSAADTRTLTNNEIKWFSFWDINPTASDDKDIGVDLALFQTKYNGKITYIPTTYDTKFDDLANLVMSGNSPDFCGADDMDIFPKGAIKKMLEPLDNYIDFDSDLWKDIKPACDQFVYKGSHYVGVSRVDPAYIWIFNQTQLTEMDIENPKEMWANGEWNWETMAQMCVDFADADNDKYALDAWYYENALTESTGLPLIGMKDGNIVNNIESLEIAKAHNVAVLMSHKSTSNLMAEIIRWLNVKLAPCISVHGVLVDVYGEGVLITGESGLGKSEAALELVKRGHRLVSDDVVEIRKVSDDTLIGTAPDITRHLIELRGIGIVDVKMLFGVSSVIHRRNTEEIPKK